jgi:UDP-glucuronate decarboxylase
LVINLTGSRSKLMHRPLPIDDPIQRCPDISQAEQLLKWQPKTPLRAGLKRTINYFDALLSRNDGQSTAQVPKIAAEAGV